MFDFYPGLPHIYMYMNKLLLSVRLIIVQARWVLVGP